MYFAEGCGKSRKMRYRAGKVADLEADFEHDITKDNVGLERQHLVYEIVLELIHDPTAPEKGSDPINENPETHQSDADHIFDNYDK